MNALASVRKTWDSSRLMVSRIGLASIVTKKSLTFPGTGTKVGDPIEAKAIHSVFSEGRTAQDPLLFGSVKSNIGHLENASGVVSVIKAAMMLDKGFVLPNTNFKTPSADIPLAEWNMKVGPQGQLNASVLPLLSKNLCMIRHQSNGD